MILLNIELSAAGDPPTELLLFKFGQNRTKKGDFNLTEKSADRLMAQWSEFGNDLPIDYDHAMFDARVKPEDRIAAGWFKPERRADGIYASQISWTEPAAQAIKKRQWRFFSPAFNQANREINELLNLALTGLPASKHQRPIVASQMTESNLEESENKMLKNLVTMLSLGAEASEADALAEISTQKQTITTLLSLTGKDASGEALGVVAGWKEGAAQTEVLSARIATLEGEKREGEVKSLLEKAILEKKVSPAEVAQLTLLGKKDFEMFKGLLSVKPVMLADASKEPEGKTGLVTLNSQEAEICAMLGVSPEAFAKTKAATPTIPTSTVTQPDATA